jgi:hypothetical protein
MHKKIQGGTEKLSFWAKKSADRAIVRGQETVYT